MVKINVIFYFWICFFSNVIVSEKQSVKEVQWHFFDFLFPLCHMLNIVPVLPTDIAPWAQTHASAKENKVRKSLGDTNKMVTEAGTSLFYPVL